MSAKANVVVLIVATAIIVAVFLFMSIPSDTTFLETSISQDLPPNFKVAFIGDQYLGSNAVSVLQLIKDEGTDMVLHQGDFDYAEARFIVSRSVT